MLTEASRNTQSRILDILHSNALHLIRLLEALDTFIIFFGTRDEAELLIWGLDRHESLAFGLVSTFNKVEARGLLLLVALP